MNRRRALATAVSSLCFFRIGASGTERAFEQGKYEGRTKGYTLRKFTAPFYSPMARQLSIEGRVTAEAHIAKDGTVSSVTNINGHPLFQTEVSNALKEWEFEIPGDDAGPLEITFQFVLKGERDQKILNYRVSGDLPTHFEIEVNPFPYNAETAN
jgi:TonB family protein